MRTTGNKSEYGKKKKKKVNMGDNLGACCGSPERDAGGSVVAEEKAAGRPKAIDGR